LKSAQALNISDNSKLQQSQAFSAPSLLQQIPELIATEHLNEIFILTVQWSILKSHMYNENVQSRITFINSDDKYFPGMFTISVKTFINSCKC